MKIRKKLALIMMGAIVMSVGLTTTKAQAKDFGMSLAPSNAWRYLTNAEDCRDTKDGTKPYGYINLNRIQDATSYYIKAKAVNSDGEDRSEPATVKQYGHADILEHHMVRGHYYYLDLKNLNYTSNYVWTSGQFGWY